MTATGALPRKIVFELYDKKIITKYFIESGMNKLAKETDVIAMLSARYTCEIAGAVKVVKGQLTMTKKGTQWMAPENLSDLFKALFRACTEKLNWGNHDGYPNHATQDSFMILFQGVPRKKPGASQTHLTPRRALRSTRYFAAFPNANPTAATIGALQKNRLRKTRKMPHW